MIRHRRNWRFGLVLAGALSWYVSRLSFIETRRASAQLFYSSTMNQSRFTLRRWAASLTLVALPLIGVAFAPSSLADDWGPCDYDMGSMSCLNFQLGGAGPNGPCGYDAGSMACLEAQTAAGANCSQSGTATADCMWSPNGGANYVPPAPEAPPTPAPGAPPTP